MRQIARCIAMTARDFEGTRNQVLEEVAQICKQFPLYE